MTLSSNINELSGWILFFFFSPSILTISPSLSTNNLWLSVSFPANDVIDMNTWVSFSKDLSPFPLPLFLLPKFSSFKMLTGQNYSFWWLHESKQSYQLTSLWKRRQRFCQETYLIICLCSMYYKYSNEILLLELSFWWSS